MSDILKRLKLDATPVAPFIATACNILMLYVVYFIARIEFMLENLSYFKPSLHDGNFWHIITSGCVFDTPGIFYTNLLYIFMMLLPLHLKERRVYYLICKWTFTVINSLAFAANLADSVYFPFTMRRTTWDATGEFAHETNLWSIFGVELLHHWYLLLLCAAVIWGMWHFYTSPSPTQSHASSRIVTSAEKEGRGATSWRYYTVSILALAVAACICVGAVRGGWLNHWYCYILAIPAAISACRLYISKPRTVWCKWGSALSALTAVILIIMAPIGGWRNRDIRPIALSNANAYAIRPVETALILNTPFALIRSVSANNFENPGYFPNPEIMSQIYTPDHNCGASAPDTLRKHKNVVIIIIESFGQEYIASLNKDVLGERSVGYAPFMDSLVTQSVRFRHTYDNGTKSIDAMPSILAGIPKFVKPFILTSSAMQPIRALPAILAEKGYETAFYHGARTGSMGFDGFARLVGFRQYRGREDFNEDPRFNGDNDFDGYWAIWDEPFMQYFALSMTELQQPFMTTLFTASSHHPFRVPAEYEGKFPQGTLPIHKCIGYTDMALQKFFETASRQPWYDNTIFVITNDHTNARDHDEYRSDIGAFYGPLIIFDPSGDLTPGVREGIAQQTDIMPTILGFLGYSGEYTAYGLDLIATPTNETWAVNHINGTYQYVANGYVLKFDGAKSIGFYDIDDHLMQHNLLTDRNRQSEIANMERHLKAIIQTYMIRKGR